MGRLTGSLMKRTIDQGIGYYDCRQNPCLHQTHYVHIRVYLRAIPYVRVGDASMRGCRSLGQS